jgi:integrase/recombinase XerD
LLRVVAGRSVVGSMSGGGRYVGSVREVSPGRRGRPVTGSAVAVAPVVAVEVSGVVDGPTLVEAWLASIGSRNTRAAYWSDFQQYAEHCELAGVAVLDARRVDVDAFRLRLVEVLGRKPSSVARAITSVSSFYEYCIDVGALENNPSRRVKRPRTGEGHVTETPGMPWADVLRLVDAARTLDERALLVVLAYMGLRVSEALSLDVDSVRVEGEHAYVTVTGKGGTVDRCPLVAEVLEVFADVRATGRTSGPLIRGSDGERMIRERAATIVRSLSRKGARGRVRAAFAPGRGDNGTTPAGCPVASCAGVGSSSVTGDHSGLQPAARTVRGSCGVRARANGDRGYGWEVAGPGRRGRGLGGCDTPH